MNRDRGTKKWTSLMLPEHVKQIRDFLEDDYFQVSKPVLDEQQLEEMNEKINDAMAYNAPVSFTYHKGGHNKEISGYIHYVNPPEQTLYIVDKDDSRMKLKIEDIIHIKILDK